jgi:hypothetical protein
LYDVAFGNGSSSNFVTRAGKRRLCIAIGFGQTLFCDDVLLDVSDLSVEAIPAVE